MSYLDDVAAAVWAYSTRTVDGQAAPASDGSRLDNIRYAIWTYSTRTASGGGGATISGVGGIASGAALGSPDIAATVSAAGIATAQAVGAPSIAASIVATGIASVEAVGSPAVAAALALVGIPSAAAVGQPTVSIAVSDHNVVGAGGVASQASVGAPHVMFETDPEIWLSLLVESGIDRAIAIGEAVTQEHIVVENSCVVEVEVESLIEFDVVVTDRVDLGRLVCS